MTALEPTAGRPKTRNPVSNTGTIKPSASRYRRSGTSWSQVFQRVAVMTTAGIQMMLVRTFDRKRVCQTSQ